MDPETCFSERSASATYNSQAAQIETATLAATVANRLGLAEVDRVARAAEFHDVGKTEIEIRLPRYKAHQQADVGHC